jgi:cytochrome c
MKPWKRSLAASLLLLAAWAWGAEDKLSEQDLLALLSYDLGPATIDVSKYPAHFQKTYELFMRKCSLCHTPARAINFPTVTKEDWTRFLMTMHGRAKGTLLETDDARDLADFLAYDSAERKIKHAEDFDRLQEELDQRFEAVEKERARLQSMPHR